MSRYVTRLCDFCKARQSKGFGFTPPHKKERRRTPEKMFCSKKCQDLNTQLYKGVFAMIDMTEFERECLEKTLVPLLGKAKKNELKDQLTEIAIRHNLVEETLESRGSDDMDFRDCAVWSIEAALKEAYELGRKAKK